jgi:hypothetical protein
MKQRRRFLRLRRKCCSFFLTAYCWKLLFFLGRTPWSRKKSGGIASPFLTLARDGGELSASYTCRLTPRDTGSRTHWLWDRVGPRTGLDLMERREISCLWRESNSGHAAHSRVTIPAKLPRLRFRNLHKLKLTKNIIILPCTGTTSKLRTRSTGRLRSMFCSTLA